MANESTVKASARINKEWGVRLALIALMFIGGGAYFLYDGLVGYPKQTEKYELVFEEKPDGTTVQRDNWKERLEEAGYSSDINPKDLNYKSDRDIMTQLIIAGLCFPIGLLSVFWLLVNSRREMIADDSGVKFGGARMAFDNIDSIDKTRWDSKGIAVLIGRDGSKMVLDDWKFRGAADVLAEVERELGMGDDEKDEDEPQAPAQGSAPEPEDAEQPT